MAFQSFDNRRNNPAKIWFSSRCRNAKITKGMRHAVPLGPDSYVVNRSKAPTFAHRRVLDNVARWWYSWRWNGQLELAF